MHIALTLLRTPTPLEPLRYVDAGGSTVADVRLSMRCLAGPRPVPVGIVWLKKYVSQIGSN